MGQAEDDAAKQWLMDAPAASAHILQMLSTPPTPPSGGDMDFPQNEAELRTCLDKYAAQNYVGLLDPRTNVTLTATYEWRQTTNAGRPWGVNGNYARIGMSGVGDMIRVVGTQGVSNRGFTCKNLTLDGGDANLNGAKGKACLKLSAPLGDNGPLYKFSIENVFTMMGEYGFVLEGGVYEGWMMNCHAENHAKDGTMMQHLNLGQPGQGVVSNVFMIHPNMSRCLGAGIRSVYSVYVTGGSFILNGAGAIVAPDGIRGIHMCNGENTAGPEQAAFVVPNNGYGSYIEMCEASSDGSTHCRKWDGTKWVDIGSPMLYLLAAGAGVTQKDNHVSYYGPPPNPMRVVK